MLSSDPSRPSDQSEGCELANKQTLSAILLILLCISPASITFSRTGTFTNFTVEIPDDWQLGGPDNIQVRSPDGKLIILPALGAHVLKGAQPNPDGSPNMDSITRYVASIKEKLETAQAVLQYPMIQPFATKDIGEYRSLMRAAYRMNESTIIMQYYVIGPTYVAPFSVASKLSIEDTTARMDEIFSSLKWFGTP